MERLVVSFHDITGWNNPVTLGTLEQKPPTAKEQELLKILAETFLHQHKKFEKGILVNLSVQSPADKIPEIIKALAEKVFAYGDQTSQFSIKKLAETFVEDAMTLETLAQIITFHEVAATSDIMWSEKRGYQLQVILS